MHTHTHTRKHESRKALLSSLPGFDGRMHVRAYAGESEKLLEGRACVCVCARARMHALISLSLQREQKHTGTAAKRERDQHRYPHRHTQTRACMHAHTHDSAPPQTRRTTAHAHSHTHAEQRQTWARPVVPHKLAYREAEVPCAVKSVAARLAADPPRAARGCDRPVLCGAVRGRASPSAPRHRARLPSRRQQVQAGSWKPCMCSHKR